MIPLETNWNFISFSFLRLERKKLEIKWTQPKFGLELKVFGIVFENSIEQYSTSSFFSKYKL
jgi:hypothetical protein